MIYSINPLVFGHYFNDELLITIEGNSYLLNKYQTTLVSAINENSFINFSDVINYFLGIFNCKNIDSKKIEKLNSCLQKLYDLNILVLDKSHRYNKFGGKVGYLYPLKLTIELTNKCGLSCEHCFKDCDRFQNDYLEINQLIDFLETVKAYIPSVQLTGGEPMLHPEFNQIAEYVTSNFKNTTLTTTATVINKRNIEYIKLFDNVQVSLYSDRKVSHELITCVKGSFDKTVKGIQFLEKSGCFFTVSNLLRREFLDTERFEQYIEFLIENNVPEIMFGQLSILGRAKKLDSRWRISAGEYIFFEKQLHQFKEKYSNKIYINTWEDSKHSKLLKGISDYGLACGAGLTEWTITEKGFVKPCSFFPDYYFSNYKYSEFDKIISNRHTSSIINGIEVWEEELNSVGVSTKQICEVIYHALEK